ncbi:6397_t:CDS:1, partial [Scutellospora calospora]
MPPGQTSGNGPPAMRDDLEKIVYEMNPSIRQSIRISKQFDIRDVDRLTTVDTGYSEKGDIEAPEIINNSRYIENNCVKSPKPDDNDDSYISKEPVQYIERNDEKGSKPTNSTSNIENVCA